MVWLWIVLGAGSCGPEPGTEPAAAGPPECTEAADEQECWALDEQWGQAGDECQWLRTTAVAGDACAAGTRSAECVHVPYMSHGCEGPGSCGPGTEYVFFRGAEGVVVFTSGPCRAPVGWGICFTDSGQPECACACQE